MSKRSAFEPPAKTHKRQAVSKTSTKTSTSYISSSRSSKNSQSRTLSESSSHRPSSDRSTQSSSPNDGPTSGSKQPGTPPKTISKSPTPRTTLPGPIHLGAGMQPTDLVHPTTAVTKDVGLPSPVTQGPSHDGTVTLPTVLHHGTIIRHQPPDSFPTFENGDVIITTSLGPSPQAFQLHSSVLCRHSLFFAETIRKSLQQESKTSWHWYDIQDDGGHARLFCQPPGGDRPGVARNYIQSLEEVDIKVEDIADEEPLTTDAHSECITSPTVLSPAQQAIAIACYTQILGSFYNIPLKLSTTDITKTLIQSEQLLKIADLLGCVHLLRAQLCALHAHYRQDLYLSIKHDPPRWLRLALALEDRAIYVECLIHLTGAHPKWPWPTNRKAVPESVQHLIKRKASELDTLRTEVERDLLLTNIRIQDHRHRYNRTPDPTQSSEVETWLTVQVFRDEIAQHISKVDEHPDRTMHWGKLYRGIAKGTLRWVQTDYLREVCGGVMKLAWKELGEDVVKLRGCAKGAVERLADNQLMIDPDEHGVGYLTCVKVEEGDVPWLAGEV